MTRYAKGQDVTVNYRGAEHPGQIIDPTTRHGTLLCRILIDPAMDYGEITSHLGLYSYVCVSETDVEPA